MGLRALSDTGDPEAARRLVRVLAERGDEAGLRALSDTGDDWAALRLVDLLAERGD